MYELPSPSEAYRRPPDSEFPPARVLSAASIPSSNPPNPNYQPAFTPLFASSIFSPSPAFSTPPSLLQPPNSPPTASSSFLASSTSPLPPPPSTSPLHPSSPRSSSPSPSPFPSPRPRPLSPPRERQGARDPAGGSSSSDEWIILNVGGQRYETFLSTLTGRDTMLGRMFSDQNRCMLQRAAKGEYLIDRNGRAFEAILDFLRTGELFVPEGVTKEQVLTELDFFSVTLPDSSLHLHPGPPSSRLARHFRQASHWRQPAQREFERVKEEILRLIEAEADEGMNYRIRIALLVSGELTKCSGKFGDLVKQEKAIVPHPSQLGGWCVILRNVCNRYFIDQLVFCFEKLGFSTSLSMFRYCSCEWCSRKARKTRYLTIGWDEMHPEQASIEILDRIQEILDTGVNVWQMEV